MREATISLGSTTTRLGEEPEADAVPKPRNYVRPGICGITLVSLLFVFIYDRSKPHQSVRRDERCKLVSRLN